MKLWISDYLMFRIVILLFKVLVIAAAAATNLSAGILYDRSQDAIVVTGFSSEVPCTPLTLFLTDKMNGWGKASYDKASGTCVVDAALVIGDHRSSDTWFQIGSADAPVEILVARKGVTVFPAFVKGLNPESDHRLAKKGSNILVLGVSDNPDVKATLRLGPGAALAIGYLESMPDSLQYGGGLQVYNSSITAEDESPDKRFGGNFIRFPKFSEIILKNANISCFNGEIYGLGENTSVDKCSFSEGRGVIIAKATLKDCVFERMEEAVHDFGGLDVTLVNCVFKNNKRNFGLRYNHGVTCIDCDFGTAATPDILKSLSRGGKTVYPQLLSRRHVTIFVSDAEGKPVAGARVMVNDGPKPLSESTGEDGKTPPILLDEFLVKATEAKPETTIHAYTITAAKDGKTAVRTEYCPQKDGTDVHIELK